MGRAVSLTFALVLGGCGAAPPVAPPEPATIALPPVASVSPAEGAPPAPEPPRAPPGYVEMTVLRVAPGPNGGVAVLLVDADRTVVVPIFVGGTEAFSIELRLEKGRHPRPLTHDLLDAVLGELGGELHQVQVDDLRDEVFIGSIFIRKGSHVIEVDARPSDAIALALGSGAPIYVRRTVIERAGVPRGGGPAADEGVEHL